MFRNLNFSNEKGVFLVDVLTALTISGLMMLSLAFTYLNATRSYHDQNIRIETQQRANGLLDSLLNEFKIIGSGMPLNQNNFLISDASLGDASMPILTSASASLINYRYNKDAKNSVLSTSYTPSPADLSFNVIDGSIFSVGDTIYLSNFTRAGEDGMLAEITSISSNTIGVDSSFTASTAAVFEEGSSVSLVETVIYDSPSDWSGITRDSGAGEMIILPQSKFILSYHDIDRNTLSLPLSRNDIANNLAMIHLSVQAQSDRKLKDGSNYLATAEQDIILRNLVLSRQ